MIQHLIDTLAEQNQLIGSLAYQVYRQGNDALADKLSQTITDMFKTKQQLADELRKFNQN